MNQHVSKNSDSKGQEIWEKVEKAAKSAPEWVKSNVEEASKESVNRITEKSSTKDSAKTS